MAAKKKTRAGKISAGKKGMTYDLHNHVIPETVIEAIRRNRSVSARASRKRTASAISTATGA